MTSRSKTPPSFKGRRFFVFAVRFEPTRGGARANQCGPCKTACLEPGFMKIILAALVVLLAASTAPAQNSAWIHGPKPVFVPGLYESESRNSHFQNQSSKAQVCVASADFD